jgi:hypothetical protein
MSSSLKFFLCWLSQLVTKRTHPKHKTSNSYLFILSEANPVNPLQKEEEEEEAPTQSRPGDNTKLSLQRQRQSHSLSLLFLLQ